MSCEIQPARQSQQCNTRIPGQNYGETTVFAFCRKAENSPKISFSPKNNNTKKGKRLIFIGGKDTFSFAQLCPVVARTWQDTRRLDKDKDANIDMDYDDGLSTGQKEEKMKRRLTLPSSALLGKEPEEDPKKRNVGERKEELDIEEGLASISSNHSTGSTIKM